MEPNISDFQRTTKRFTRNEDVGKWLAGILQKVVWGHKRPKVIWPKTVIQPVGFVTYEIQCMQPFAQSLNVELADFLKLCISFVDYATSCIDTMVCQRVNRYLRRCDSCHRCLAHPPPVRAQVQGGLCTYPSINEGNTGYSNASEIGRHIRRGC